MRAPDLFTSDGRRKRRAMMRVTHADERNVAYRCCIAKPINKYTGASPARIAIEIRP